MNVNRRLIELERATRPADKGKGGIVLLSFADNPGVWQRHGTGQEYTDQDLEEYGPIFKINIVTSGGVK